jgi:Delta3-Delta2-enoyl-CoA isomerase
LPPPDRHDDVYVLDLGDAQNRLHPGLIAAVNGLLDVLQALRSNRI